MSVIGIVCEFNPFHNGHKHLIDSVKKHGDTIVCVMSSNFVQRGEPAIIPKEIRAKMALLNGADIVIELPFLYATASAELFAFSAVKLLADFGCDKIAFGVEKADAVSLETAANILLSDSFNNEIPLELENGVSYPAARQKVFEKYNSEIDISTPNNILAIEYMKAIKKLNSDINPVIVKRIGAGYNENKAVDGIASASHIRELIKNKKDFDGYVPENVVSLYKDALRDGLFVSNEKFNIAALSILRNALNKPLDDIANISEGLENRIVESIKNNININEIYNDAKTKRYTHSRIRRAVLSIVMNVKAEDLKISMPYCRLLGFNFASGAKMGELVKKSALPFVATYSDIVALSCDKADRVFEIENLASNFYSLILHNSANCSREMTFTPVKL